MIADGRTVPNSEVLRADVCVVGAGPAGIAIARELAKAGFEVLLLERGPDVREGLPPDPDTAVNAGIPYRVGRSRLFTVGGATHRWHLDTPLGDGFGRLRELDEADFAVRPWIRFSGWPIDKAHLRSHYRRARSLFEPNSPLPSLQDHRGSQFRENPFCVENLIEARLFHLANPGSFAGEFRRELENSLNVILLTHSVVTEVMCSDSSETVSFLKVNTDREHQYTVEARAYVLAAGGIENPRLLLASKSRYPNGIGNGHDLVGRFFMEHPHFPSGYLIPGSRRSFDNYASYQVHLEDGVPIQIKYGLSENVVESEELSRCVYYLQAVSLSGSIKRIGYSDSATESLEAVSRIYRAVRDRHWPRCLVGDFGCAIRGAHHVARDTAYRAASFLGTGLKLARFTQPYLFLIRGMAEQVPNPSSRVSLEDSRDGFGVPIARLDWRLTDQDVESMRRTQELFGDAQLKAGHRLVESYLEERILPPRLGGGNHHMGTTRMADSPGQGVVDRNCRVHGLNNLFVAGSSVFPTGGYANPTLTLLALAIRLSDHLVSRFAEPIEI